MALAALPSAPAAADHQGYQCYSGPFGAFVPVSSKIYGPEYKADSIVGVQTGGCIAQPVWQASGTLAVHNRIYGYNGSTFLCADQPYPVYNPSDTYAWTFVWTWPSCGGGKLYYNRGYGNAKILNSWWGGPANTGWHYYP